MMTRRAGVAAEDAAAAWSEEEVGGSLLTDGGGSLRRHGKDAALQAQGQLEAWFTEMGDLAASSSRWTRVSNRRRIKLIEGIWRTVLDAERPVPKLVVRALEDPQTAAKGGRDLLVAAADAALEADAERFLDHLGPAPDASRIGRMLTAASTAASAAASVESLRALGSPPSPDASRFRPDVSARQLESAPEVS
jgi:hypothetical protein